MKTPAAKSKPTRVALLQIRTAPGRAPIYWPTKAATFEDDPGSISTDLADIRKLEDMISVMEPHRRTARDGRDAIDRRDISAIRALL